MYKFKQILAGAALTMLAFNVTALPSVTGSLQMTGAFFALDANSDRTSDGAVATGIDFDLFGTDRFRATLGDGSFAGLAGQLGNITDFQFDPLTVSIADFCAIIY